MLKAHHGLRTTVVAPTPWAVVVAISGVSILTVGGVVWRFRSNPGSRLFAVLLALSAFYTFGYAAQVLATTQAGKLLWLKVQYVALVVLPVASLVFALDYTGRSDWITKRSLAALLFLPLVTLVAIWLEPGHGLVLTDVHLVGGPGHRDLEYGFGPLGYAFLAFQYFLHLLTPLLFFALVVRGHDAYRRQGWILFAAFLAPIVAAVVPHVVPSVTVDPTPLAFLVPAVLVTWGVYRSGFLDVVPVDRDRTLDGVRGAIVVLDSQHRIVDGNATARERFGDAFAVGDDVDAVLRSAGFEQSVRDLDDGASVTATGDGRSGDEPRRYEVSRDEIETWGGDRRGLVLTFYDVTDRWRAERTLQDRNEQLAVLSRLLRHDIRNDAAVILGWVETLESAVDPRHEAAVDSIRASGRHITELTETAQGLTDALVGEADPALEPVRLDRVLAETVEAARSQYPDATFDEPASYPAVTIQANGLLSSVFRNLLNNAVQHNDGDPAVTVEMETDGTTARVTVADDGPGIPASMADALFERGEKGLDSGGTGLGLHLVEHLVETYDGTAEVRPNDPRGTRIVVRLPIAE